VKLKISNQYKKDLKKVLKSGLRIKSRKNVIENIIETLLSGGKLEIRYKDHALVGQWKGYRDCHIEPDLVMIYFIDVGNEILEITRIGSHSELFS
jgi:mRNA interferase YafQ